MSREWAGATRHEGWVMACDNWSDDCKTVSEPQRDTELLPLERFVSEGWFIAKTHGDRCPACVAAAGGMQALTTARGREGGPGQPHRLMSEPVQP